VGARIVAALTRLESTPVVTRGAAAAPQTLAKHLEATGAAVAAQDVPPRSLRDSLRFDESWGPTEWGPIPFLPPPDLLSRNMEAAWGDLDRYRGLNSTANGNLFVGGIQVRFLLSCLCRCIVCMRLPHSLPLRCMHARAPCACILHACVCPALVPPADVLRRACMRVPCAGATH
jgi:hypothetical protein